MRVLAMTRDASLQVALGSMMPDLELRSVLDASRASAEEAFASVALVDLGSTEAGLEAARALTLPCVVVGETRGGDDERVHVLVRPFSLGELGDAIAHAAELAREADEARAALAEIAHEIPEIRIEDEEPEIAAEPEPEVPVIATGEPEPLVAIADPEPSAVVEAPEPFVVVDEPEPETTSIVMQEPAPLRLVVDEPEEAEEPAIEVDLLAELDEPADAIGAMLADLDEPAPPPKPEPRIVRRQPRRVRPLKEILPRKRVPLSVRPEPVPEPAPAAGVRPAHQSDPMTRRLGTAVMACKELDSLLADVPLLAQPRAVAHAFLNEVVELFGPQTAAVYIQRPEGSWGVLAPHGLSKIEADIRVAPDHVLFREVATGLNGIYIAPVDLAGGLVAGIGGARTETLMVAPLVAGGACCGIVVAGGPRFTEIDLEHLCDIANDAAAGLAFAQTVERLRAKL